MRPPLPYRTLNCENIPLTAAYPLLYRVPLTLYRFDIFDCYRLQPKNFLLSPFQEQARELNSVEMGNFVYISPELRVILQAPFSHRVISRKVWTTPQFISYHRAVLAILSISVVAQMFLSDSADRNDRGYSENFLALVRGKLSRLFRELLHYYRPRSRSVVNCAACAEKPCANLLFRSFLLGIVREIGFVGKYY